MLRNKSLKEIALNFFMGLVLTHPRSALLAGFHQGISSKYADTALRNLTVDLWNPFELFFYGLTVRTGSDLTQFMMICLLFR